MLSPFEFAALSHDRYEERLREAARNHAFDAAVNRFIRSTLAASGRRLAALRNAFTQRSPQARFDGIDLRPRPSAK